MKSCSAPKYHSAVEIDADPSKNFYPLEITDPLAAELGAGAAYVRLID
jgi:hypothetical protein